MQGQSDSASARVALVTGGRTGIGAASALALARAGFSVAIVDRVEDGLSRTTLAALEAIGNPSCFVKADIADLDQHGRILDRVTGTLGELSCVVNNAGVQMQPRVDLLEVTPEMFDVVFGVNVRGTFFLAQQSALRLARSSAALKTLIVITSVNATLASTEKSAYCMSKAALSMMTRLFSVRMAAQDVNVYEIRPGLIRTEMTRPVFDKYSGAIANGQSLTRRWGEPEDVARTVRALASGELTFMTGEILNVGGGIQIARL
jgi:NAD(P)-dependent dehydrogenase (short-subunit alcohol dehydrogenase family)